MLGLAVKTSVTAAIIILFRIVHHKPKWAGPLEHNIYMCVYLYIYIYIYISRTNFLKKCLHNIISFHTLYFILSLCVIQYNITLFYGISHYVECITVSAYSILYFFIRKLGQYSGQGHETLTLTLSTMPWNILIRQAGLLNVTITALFTLWSRKV